MIVRGGLCFFKKKNIDPRITKNLLLKNKCKNCGNCIINIEIARQGYSTTAGINYQCSRNNIKIHDTCIEWIGIEWNKI